MEIQPGSTSRSTAPANRFDALLQRHGTPVLEREAISVLQINVGKLCNQTCTHCHVEAGPKRREIMDGEVVQRMLELARAAQVRTVDLTGGAPEMNPHFRRLVEGISAQGKEIIARCNLTILLEPGYEDAVDFYATHRVHLVCSLPCYTPENVAQQRGKGVFERSIEALQRLNAAGYGAQPGGDGGNGNGNRNGRAGLVLDLVFNPLGASLPGSQAKLEADYKRELGTRFGIRFNRLLTLANLPIGRFARSLRRQEAYEPYLRLLEDSFNPGTVPGLMCRNTLNVGWDGQLYDCDFNQMLELPLGHGTPSLFDPAFHLDALRRVPVRTGEHCLGCTAGAGSSCGGALT